MNARLSPSSRSTILVLCTLAASAADGREPAEARQAGLATERRAGPTIDFIAVQADGTPVADLQAFEVEVRIDDRVRTLRSIRRVTTAPVPAVQLPSRAVLPPYGDNDSVAAGRLFVLVVDQESFVAGGEQLVRSAVEGLLGQLTPADRAMVAALPFGGVKVPFTSQAARIRAAVNGLSAQGSRNETGSELACRTRRFLESLDGFLQDQAGAGSPLTVILFTAGLGAPRRDAPMALAPGMCELLVNHFRRVAVTASAVRANIYLAQPADVGMSGARWRESISGVGYLGSDNPLEGIEHFAGATGSARVPLDATGTASLLRVARESSAFYEAELEPERGEALDRSRSLAVRVARRGVTVRARPEITFAQPVRRTGATRLTVPDLLAATTAATDLRLRVAGFTVREADGRLRVGVVVEPADPAVVFDSVGAILIADNGQVEARWYAKDPAERPLMGAMAALPGTYRLRVAALDTTGRFGTAEDVVVAGLTPIGPISLGSLMLGVSRADGTKPKLEFGSEPTAIASFDIYAGATSLCLSATLEVARAEDGPALVTLPVTLTRADDTRVVATGSVPLGALPPGDYVVRGVIQLEDGTTGRVMRTLRKVVGAAREPPLR